MFIFCVNIINIFAEPVIPKCFNVVQNNGDTIEVYLKGDEYGSWYETKNGDIIDIEPNNQNFYYVKPVSDSLVLSNIIVYNNNVSIFDRNLVMTIIDNNRTITYNTLHPSYIDFDSTDQETMVHIQNLSFNDSIHQQRIKKRIEPINSKKILTILIEFQDIKFEDPLNIRNLVDSMINEEYYSLPNINKTFTSVNSYYKSASYNKLNLTSDVVGPYTANHNRKFYGAKTWLSNDVIPQRLVYEAICKAANEVDFSDYDNDGDGYVECIHVLFAGQGQNEDGAPDEAIWPHQSTMFAIYRDNVCISSYILTPEKYQNNYRGIGTICHELGHIFGAPDFYDTKNDTFPGTSTWDLMGGGNWNGAYEYADDCYIRAYAPAHPNPYIKTEIFGWTNAIELSGNNKLYTLRPSELDKNSIYKLSTSTQGEYYLLENRQDPNLWSTGLLVYHVHKNIKNGFLFNNVNVKHPQNLYVVDANNHIAKPTGTPESYGNIDSPNAPLKSTNSRNIYFTSTSLPSNCAWDGTPTQNKDVCFISEELVNGEMCIKFVLNPAIEGPDVLCDSAIYSLKHVPSNATIEWTYVGAGNVSISGTPFYITSGQGTKNARYKRGSVLKNVIDIPGPVNPFPWAPLNQTAEPLALKYVPYEGTGTIKVNITFRGETYTLTKDVYMPGTVEIDDLGLGLNNPWIAGTRKVFTLASPTDIPNYSDVKWDVNIVGGNSFSSYGASVAITPSSNVTTVSITATYTRGCDGNNSHTITIPVTTRPSLSFANPASGSVEISVVEGNNAETQQTMSISQSAPYIGAYRLELWHDVYGKVRELDVPENTPTITMNLDGLNSGVYVLRLIIDNQIVETSQLIIK